MTRDPTGHTNATTRAKFQGQQKPKLNKDHHHHRLLQQQIAKEVNTQTFLVVKLKHRKVVCKLATRCLRETSDLIENPSLLRRQPAVVCIISTSANNGDDNATTTTINLSHQRQKRKRHQYHHHG